MLRYYAYNEEGNSDWNWDTMSVIIDEEDNIVDICLSFQRYGEYSYINHGRDSYGEFQGHNIEIFFKENGNLCIIKKNVSQIRMIGDALFQSREVEDSVIIEMKRSKINIAIDGPAGSGKSTTARKVAELTGHTYIDTGAMYRAVTLQVLRQNIDPNDEDAVAQIAKDVKIELKQEKDKTKVLLNGEDVSQTIRSEQITNNIGPVARNPRGNQFLHNFSIARLRSL